MTKLEAQRVKDELNSQPIDLPTKIKSIYDKVDNYTSKRGSEQEAIDIVNSELLFSDDALFASWENGVLELKEIILKDGQMEGDFHLQLRNHLSIGVLELIDDYIEFIEINYKKQLNVQDINELTKQVTDIINGFVVAEDNDYKIDLGEEKLISMAGWEDISLASRESKLYIKGALLRFEDDSDFITRVSKQDDIYILQGKDGSEARLSIRSTRLVLESDFVNTTKLPLYVQALDEYLLEDYKVKFGLVEEKKRPETVVEEKKMVRRGLFQVLTTEGISDLFVKKNWYEETRESKMDRISKEEKRNVTEKQEKETILEDMRGEALLSDELENDDGLSDFASNLDENISRGDELVLDDSFDIDEKTVLDRQKEDIEAKVEDKQLVTIINRCLEHIDKKKYTIEKHKNKGMKNKRKNIVDSKIKELTQIVDSILDVNLLEIYRYYRRYLWKDKGNIAYLKNIIRNKLDIHTIGFNHYFNCGNDVKVYKTHDDESNHDIGYSSNGLNIHASVQRNIRMTHNTQSGIEESKQVATRPLRRYSRDGDYMMMSKTETPKGEKKGIYEYCVHHLDSGKAFLDINLKIKEKISLTRRCTYDMVDDYLLVVGDGKVRVISIDEDRTNDFVFSVDSENYTIATESRNLFVYSNKKLVLYYLTDKNKTQVLSFSDLLGNRAEVLYMHARKGQVKIIYMKDGKLNYSCYNEKDLVSNVAYANPLASGLLDNAGFVNPTANYDISKVNNIDLASKIQGAELFFSEDNKYAIFVKNNIIYTIKFTEYGVKLFMTETMGLNHIFRVKFSPDGSHAILRDGSSIYKLDLEIIDELQTDENLEEQLKLLEGRKQLVTVIQGIHNKELNIQIESEVEEAGEMEEDDITQKGGRRYDKGGDTDLDNELVLTDEDIENEMEDLDDDDEIDILVSSEEIDLEEGIVLRLDNDLELDLKFSEEELNFSLTEENGKKLED